MNDTIAGASPVDLPLGRVPDELWHLITLWSEAHPSPMGRQDIGWAIENCVRSYATAVVAAERERTSRLRTLLDTVRLTVESDAINENLRLKIQMALYDTRDLDA